MRYRSGAFTLVEILIVVVILGILAAITVPQFASATGEAQKTATFDQLTKVRQALAVYYVRNNAHFPDVVAGDGTWGQLMTEGYLKKKPFNFWIGGGAATVITIGTSPDSAYQDGYGWIYDPGSGSVWAGSFDAADAPYVQP